MSNGDTIRERLVRIETQLKYLNTWNKGIVLAVLASLGINIAI